MMESVKIRVSTLDYRDIAPNGFKPVRMFVWGSYFISSDDTEYFYQPVYCEILQWSYTFVSYVVPYRRTVVHEVPVVSVKPIEINRPSFFALPKQLDSSLWDEWWDMFEMDEWWDMFEMSELEDIEYKAGFRNFRFVNMEVDLDDKPFLRKAVKVNQRFVNLELELA